MHPISYLCLVSNDFVPLKPLPGDKLVQLRAQYGVENCDGNKRGWNIFQGPGSVVLCSWPHYEKSHGRLHVSSW